ncbi:PilW family protein [Mesoterricola silvestris]|uniref:Prepilin-type N-terminal cleavage/methylation domain-containing protein n=1 Tax=Mesoterricola silvestris TaxID=2927979 RepID=A0AA48K9S2_9BACT|nr:prepilin-type N-terminal cleavage/methylation domain-containing protein [Mesoterricola silvestris]BDU73370.1 hypothetical protein METEAL_25440 [Mesoterricola silvestris]
MRRSSSLPEKGFSLVELLVAMLFTSILMAGLAGVFRSSINTFATASESLASARRNRLSLDMLQEDLNQAGMFLENLTLLPQLTLNNPGFYILPNQPVRNDADANVAAGGTLPTTADELYIYMDSALSAEATLLDRIPGLDEFVAGGGVMPATPLTFRISFDDPEVAKQVAGGQFVVFKDWYRSKLITSVTLAGSVVTVTPDPNPQVTVPGCGASYYDKFPHPATSPVVVVNRGRMVRYRIKAKALDPSGTLVPCLVREELPYNPSGNAATPTSIFPVGTPDQVIAEEVSALKVYLSGNMGASWAGDGLTASDFATGWTSGILTALQGQFTNGASILNDPTWFRANPALVKIDLTTRTPTKRAEYLADGSTNVTQGYKDRRQSLVILPRHFGLTL